MSAEDGKNIIDIRNARSRQTDKKKVRGKIDLTNGGRVIDLVQAGSLLETKKQLGRNSPNGTDISVSLGDLTSKVEKLQTR